MQKLTAHDIRERYLAFFEKQGHVRIPSAPLVPENDPTTLFTGSGMQPMVPYLLGQKHPLGNRLTDSQKCLRVADIDEVGDNRHTTFFEMLGNWSLGDYFKADQIPWIFEFLTGEAGLDPQRLYVTVFRGNESLGLPKDEESAGIWKEVFKEAGIEAAIVDFPERDGMQNGRIFYYDERKNWWSRSGVPQNMPVGEPGGPDSEMFWDFGAERKLHEASPYKSEPCHPNCDCGRFMEIGNSVFMEYVKTENGFTPLPQKNVDFGGGLERITAAHDDEPDVLSGSLFASAREALERLSGKLYEQDVATTRAFRIVMDHLRAVVFLIADGVVPATKDQGYFTRRLLRRAIRYANNLGVEKTALREVGQGIAASYAAAYPEVAKNAKKIGEIIEEEEVKFRATLAAGLRMFEQMAGQLKTGDTLPVKDVFDLYQSYGFPLEVTQELAQERGLQVPVEEFKVAFVKHQELSRTGAEKKFKGGLADHSEMSVKYHTATHLLHQALRTVLGEHVLQKGSNITPERLRFDFSHTAKMTPEEIRKVEDLINQKIQEDLRVHREELMVDEARAKGALGLFGHKYGEKVTVYSVGDFSIEICGGPHVEHTRVLGTFKITKEEAVSTGVRRIKAVLK